MAKWETTITDKGNELEAKQASGSTLSFTSVVSGSGTVPVVKLKEQTAVSGIRQRLTVESINVRDKNYVITVMLSNNDLTAGYNLTQIGFYATDPDEGEILFAIAQIDEAKAIPSNTESAGYNLEFAFTFKNDNNATIDITPDVAGLMSRAGVEGVIEEELGNVPNVTTNDQTPTYTEATTLSKLTSGEKLSVAFGKLAKAVTDLISHIGNKSNPHAVTKSQVGLGNVGNFKAVSTVASQGLSDTEKSNARTNIGLGNVENKSSATIRGELTSSNVTTALGYTPLDSAKKGSANGVAELGSDGKVPSSQLPSYVDDVLEYSSKSSFPSTGETGKIYVDTSTNLTYRWSGSAYVEISQSLALGETSSTAYRGDRGKTAYEHSQKTSGNPHGVTKSDVGLGSVDNTADLDKPISTATQTALDEINSDLERQTVLDKFDGELIQGRYIHSNGRFYNDSSFVTFKNPIYCKENDVVVVKIELANLIPSAAFYDSNGEYVSGIDKTNKFIIPSGVSQIRVNLYKSEGLTPSTAGHIELHINNEIDQLNEGLEQLEYSDVAGGKNRVDLSKCVHNFLDSSTGELTGNTGFSTTDFLNVDANKTYSCNTTIYRYAFYDTNKSYISGGQDTNKIVIPNNCTYIRFTYDKDYKVQFEEGEVSTQYEPYIPSVKMLAEDVTDIHDSLGDYGLDNVFDGKFVNGYINPDGTITAASDTRTSKNSIQCSANDLITVVLDRNVYSADIFAYNSSNTVVGNIHVTYTNKFEYTAPSDTSYIKFDFGESTDPDSVTAIVYINNQIDELKNDLGNYAPKANPTFTGTVQVGSKGIIAVNEDGDQIALELQGVTIGTDGDYLDAFELREQGDPLSDLYMAKSNPTGTGAFSLNRKSGTTVGSYSVAIGNNTTSSGNYSYSEGSYTTASGKYSHAEGSSTTASGECSHAEGFVTTALEGQHAQGHYNNTTTATANCTAGTSTGTAFVIGNGANTSSHSNAFRVRGDGKVFGSGDYNSSGADYAEFEEWADGNPNNEDRVGYFVTYDENSKKKIRIANAGDWILGVYSGAPCIIGNSDEDWMQRYILDDFGRKIEETFEYEETVIDEETGEKTTVIKTGTKWKENPDYDSSRQYVQRSERKEWATIGWMGVINVRDDGTCKQNGFCKVADGGIATEAMPEEGSYLNPIYRVIDRVSDNVIRVVIRF